MNDKVRMQKANAMGKTPSVGTGGGNPYKTGAASKGSTGGSSPKKPSSVPKTTTHAKPKGAC